MLKHTLLQWRAPAILASALFALTLSHVSAAQDHQMSAMAEMEDTITVGSSAFDHHGTIPLAYTAYGDNLVPQITWADLPEGTEQLALVMDDPIAPTPQPFVHWVAYNIPAAAGEIPEGLPRDAQVTTVPALAGMINGINGIRQTGYFGPRPPVDGKLHAYHFRIYALDTALNLPEGLNKADLLAAIEGHILGTGMLMGHYQREE
ncbi:YbhB/YbcL family Raf kinase inhibitor-like protein [Pseudohongiella sp. SYSU M77423]|uniref:YbhB/YbcL family Raf kinase inhibitor-like protein n=1 Tax=unclassified Pseudohongiella TaxID=2629611 RepID=UPI001F20834E|nr:MULTISPECIES: YbhB/YbcL family Raf kinase inhibitor-like protein [unclassified Pseudohongiella]MDH7943797.1 YbhB/YbcL family Raf kinase inhibitor-like protein [Pseudohongiella sp. SYSU M77423]